MSNNENANTATSGATTSYMGRVKWFNNRAGYGFVTVLNEDRKGEDVFAHHSGIKVDQEQYRYLVQGEYVSFAMSRSDSKDHQWQATDVRGILREKLMCETHWDMRKEREERARGNGNETGYRHPRNNRTRENQRENPRERVRQYGGGPREDSEGFQLAKGGHHQNSSPQNKTQEKE